MWDSCLQKSRKSWKVDPVLIAWGVMLPWQDSSNADEDSPLALSKDFEGWSGRLKVDLRCKCRKRSTSTVILHCITFTIYLCIHILIHLSVFLQYPSIYLSICLSIYPSICIHPSIRCIPIHPYRPCSAEPMYFLGIATTCRLAKYISAAVCEEPHQAESRLRIKRLLLAYTSYQATLVACSRDLLSGPMMRGVWGLGTRSIWDAKGIIRSTAHPSTLGDRIVLYILT